MHTSICLDHIHRFIVINNHFTVTILHLRHFDADIFCSSALFFLPDCQTHNYYHFSVLFFSFAVALVLRTQRENFCFEINTLYQFNLTLNAISISSIKKHCSCLFIFQFLCKHFFPSPHQSPLFFLCTFKFHRRFVSCVDMFYHF